jgi:hypothetical protein
MHRKVITTLKSFAVPIRKGEWPENLGRWIDWMKARAGVHNDVWLVG